MPRNGTLKLSRLSKLVSKPGRVRFTLRIRKRAFLKARAHLRSSRRGTLQLRTTYTTGGRTVSTSRGIRLKR